MPHRELEELLPVPLESATRYDDHRVQVAARVDAALFRRPDLGVLIGDANSAAVRELHRYMGAFLSSVFRLGLSEILLGGLPRLLSGYRLRGMAPEYFHALPALWRDAVEEQLGQRAVPLVKIFDWLEEHPEHWIPDGRAQPPLAPEEVEGFVSSLIHSDYPAAQRRLREAREGGAGLADIFVGLVQPAMYEIGRKWETGEISPAQEHLASAMVSRLLAAVTPDESPSAGRTAVVTTSPTETHEFGAWMVSDILRESGWDVRFLGSQLPAPEILHFLRSVKPELLACSVTLEVHLPSLSELVEMIREDDEVSEVLILVGGQAFAGGDRIWQATGADAVAHDAKSVVTVAEALLARSHSPQLH